jgi:hypothetical protein
MQQPKKMSMEAHEKFQSVKVKHFKAVNMHDQCECYSDFQSESNASKLSQWSLLGCG